MSERRFVVQGVIAVSLILSLFVSGCQNRPTVDEIVANVRKVEASTEDAHAVIEVSFQGQPMEGEFVVEAWEKRPNKFRAEVLKSSDPEFADIVSVTDGQRGWMYNPNENQVIAGEAGQDEPTSPRQMLQLAEDIIQKVLDKSEIQLVGEEEVAGLATYKLEFTPKEDSEGSVLPIGSEGTLWVDQERWIVLQAHFVGSVLGEAWMRVRSFDLNSGIADDRFHFEIPEDAQVIAIDDVRPVVLTLDEAREQTEFPLLVPAYLPEGASLIDVFAVEGAYVLRYDHSTVSFTVMQRLAGSVEGKPVGVEITVRGHSGTLLADEDAGKSLLAWTEDGVDIAIAGDIGQDEILQVAESLQ